MPFTSGLPPAARRAVKATGAVLAGLLAALALHNAGVLGGSSLDDLFNVWVYSGIEVLVCALVLARGLAVREERGAWLALGAGIACYVAGDIYYTLFLENAASQPSPAPSDAGYLLFYPLVYVALARLVGAHARDAHANVWLDGAIGGLTLAAVGSAIVLEPVIDATHGTTAAVATNLAYPVADLLLIVFVFGVFALTGWRPGRAWLLIGLGLALTGIADSVYLFRVAEDTYVPGTLLDVMWPAGLALLALAAWSPPRPRDRNPLASIAVMVVPCFFGAVALLLLIRGNYDHVGLIPEVLAASALLVAGLRFAVSFQRRAQPVIAARAPGAHRLPDGPRQPAPLLRPAERGDRGLPATRHHLRAADDRPRPLQGTERHARPLRRRPGPAAARPADAGRRARRGRGPPRRRRVRADPARRVGSRRGRRTAPQGARAPVRARRADRLGPGLDRDRACSRRTRRPPTGCCAARTSRCTRPRTTAAATSSTPRRQTTRAASASASSPTSSARSSRAG